MPIGIDDECPLGQPKWPLDPAALAGVILIDGRLCRTADDQFAAPILVQIAQSDRLKRYAVQSRDQRRIFNPFLAIEAKCRAGLDDRDVSIAVDDAKMRFRIDHRRKIARHPGISFCRPHPRLLHLLIADHHVDEPVIVQIEQPHAVVGPIFSAQRLAAQHVLIDPLLALAKRKKLHLLSMLPHRMIDQFNHLGIGDPAVRVIDEKKSALLEHRHVDGRFHVGHRARIHRLVDVLRLPVAGRDARHLPAQFSDDVGIRIVFDGVDE